MTLLSEYSIDWPYSERTRVGSRVQMALGGALSLDMEPKIEPSPSSSQPTSRGMGDHGAWLDTRGISAISGARSGVERSLRWNASRVYWSGMVAQLKLGPW